jgi:GNAT superfamily N-acetyltransferase
VEAVKPVILDVDLTNLHLSPKECLTSVYWEIDEDSEDLDPFFLKEEWFSSTLLEWGPCGRLLMEGDEVWGFAQYAPPTLFPRLTRFPAATVSGDAAYLGYCYVVGGRRGRGSGAELVRSVARDVVDRGYLAVEALGDREWDGGWVLPEGFLSRCGFRVIREHPRFPLLRLDLLERAPQPAAVAGRVAFPLPAFQSV